MIDLSRLRIIDLWRRMSGLPTGKWLFSFLIGRVAPYSGSIGAIVDVLEPGFARLHLKDRRRVRNHLHSIHAIALANLGEFTSGLALYASMPSNSRGIITKLTIVYLKKARGTLRAECHCSVPEIANEDKELILETVIIDSASDSVARVAVTWRVGLIK